MKVLVIAPCLFATLISVSLAAKNRFIDDYWQMSVDLGYYETAWEAIGKEGVYHLTFTTDRRPYNCVQFKVTATFTKQNVFQYDVTMYNSSTTFAYEYNGSAIVLPDVRGLQTDIEWIDRGGVQTHKTKVVYTEVDSKCFVLFYPHSGDYELWVYETEIPIIPRCCLFAFTFVTYEVYTYFNFNSTLCKRVVEETGD